MTLVEICTDNSEDTVCAIQCGADRIELCSDLANDGLTPTKDLFESVHRLGTKYGVVIFPMIRCRSGNFVFSQEDKETMIRDAVYFAHQGAPGLVIGALTSDGQVDIDFVEKLLRKVREVNPAIELTFHKAIDSVTCPFMEAVQLLEPYCSRVLTSGGQAMAELGASVIQDIGNRNENPRPLAAGKIRPENVLRIIELTGVSEVHSRSPSICGALGKPMRDVDSDLP